MTPKPLSVYLDQNIYGHMRDQSDDWKKSEIGLIVDEAQKNKVVEVWAGPTHVLETVQCSDDTRRKKIALAMLEVIESRRMWWGHEFEALHDFCSFILSIAPEGLRYYEYLQYRMET